MKRRPDCQNRITKVRKLSRRTTEKLGSNKAINGNGKRCHKETVWQEEMKPTRTEGRWQHVGGDQEYPIKSTLK